MRERIIAEIRRVAKEMGRSPGRDAFQKNTGIPPYQWLGRYWATWGDALREAGFEPNSLQGKSDANELLVAVADATIAIGRFPSHAELSLYLQSVPGGPTAKNVQSHFPRRHMLVEALRAWIPENNGYQSLLGSLPDFPIPVSEQVSDRQAGHVYLLRSGDYYKVGQSSDLERRVKSINVALPDKASLEHAISTDDPPGIEAYWHRRFADRRMNGEWFKLSKADILAFKKRKFQ